MPVYNFTCGACAQPTRRFFASAAPEHVPCPKCGGALKRAPSPPSANVVERLDAPHMARAIERPADAERLYKERAAQDPLKDA